MKSKFVILLLGCSPFMIGRLCDWAIFNIPAYPHLLISVLMLLFWAYLSIFTLKLMNNNKKALLLLNTPAIVNLLLVIVQEWIFGAYWMNYIGIYSQLFFLPLIGLGFRLVPWAHSVPPAYIAAFFLMALTSFLFYKKKNR